MKDLKKFGNIGRENKNKNCRKRKRNKFDKIGRKNDWKRGRKILKVQ